MELVVMTFLAWGVIALAMFVGGLAIGSEFWAMLGALSGFFWIGTAFVVFIIWLAVTLAT